MRLTNLNIGTRLSGAFAVLLLLIGVMLASALWQLERIDEAKTEMTQANYKSRLAATWREGIATNSIRTLAKANSTDPADEQALDSDMKTVSAQVSKVQEELEGLVTSAQGKANLQAVATQRKIYSAVRTELFKRKAEQGMSPEFKAAVSEKLLPELKKYLALVEEVAAYQNALFQDADKRIDSVYTSSRQLLLVLGLAALACGIALGWLLTRSITRPLARAVDLARQVASGDLTADIQVSSKDEVGMLLCALKDMNASLLNTVSEVRSGTDTIVTASQQIATGNLDLSARTEQQASSLEETASSMEELTSTVRQNADNARQANTLAQSASGMAARGGEVVAQVVDTMASISESSKKIADIIAVIDGIAFQTNILALNAAVEAARAGEQGRGFAVVASEVRNLAQRSAAAAREIRGLITDSVGKVDAGGQLVGQAGATMQEIVQGIARVTDIMSEIAGASAEQTLGIEQINAAITQMDDVTQQNAALVEEAAAAASSLEDQAASLALLVSRFTLDSGAAKHDAMPGTRLAPAGAPVPARQLALG
ncbi:MULTISPECIES: methyl-accepting chemotaxis protein [unclassified Massilia]|uniref:methyl-accepting chemotaxis protein n=1 Tax=unclassified Massilia TaxID=2609279 RepID=UPI00177BE032|nr:MULTISPECIES: methyl-accepting chemotaxis protein [unclassified Massilia]MBD8528881.1 HAMP domain-containing protein [Massilia sp. CFBP 13647]MBD8673523.1 HAMP domain-containing protein [Massilia sp. CFBP 13721]